MLLTVRFPAKHSNRRRDESHEWRTFYSNGCDLEIS